MYPRSRSQGVFKDVFCSHTSENETCSSGLVFNFVDAPVGVNGEVRETHDFVTPGYSRRSASGEIINNPFRTALEIQTCSGKYLQARTVAPSCTAPLMHAVYDWTGPVAYFDLNWPPGRQRVHRHPLISNSDIRDAKAVAATAAWSKSNSHSADVLVDVAEMRQTLNLLRDPIQSTSMLFRKLKSLKAARNVSGLDVIDYANSLWLQYRFGIRPLVASVNGVVKALSSKREKHRQTHRGSYSLKSDSFVPGHYSAPSVTPVNFDYTLAYKDEVIIRTGLLIEEEVGFAQELGVDASGLLALPWELVPFSFVADWFANTNTFLSSLVPYLTTSPLSTWTTTTRRLSTIFNVVATGITPAFTVTRDAVETRSAVFVEKTRDPSLGIPTIVRKPQALDKVFNDLRVIDAFALLQKQFVQIFMR